MHLRGPALAEHILALPASERDAWVDTQLGFGPPLPDVAFLPRGAVPYLPCPVSEIVAAVREAPLDTNGRFVDIGAGAGRVAILAHLLSGAPTHGIELQGHLVASARDRCAALGLSAVSFTHADAAEGVPGGTVFFMYAPCNGELLARVLAQLERAAQPHPIVVCAVDLVLDCPWLRARASTSLALTLYDSVALSRA